MDIDNANERRDIEDYMKHYCLEECLDEALNIVVTERPTNPYVLLTQCLESKTMPEIIDFMINPVFVSRQMYGVSVTVITNIASFSGCASYAASTDNFELKDYSAVTSGLKDVLRDVDFTKLSKVDELIISIPGIDPAESLAASIACCKAAARHRGLKLYNYIGELTGVQSSQLSIPVPAASILARSISDSSINQEIMVFPVSKISSTFDEVIAQLLKLSRQIANNEEMKGRSVISITGCPTVVVPNIGSLLKIVSSSLAASDLTSDIRMGFNVSASRSFKIVSSETGDSYVYQPDGAQSAADLAATASPATKGGKAAKQSDAPVELNRGGLSGQDLVDLVATLWQENEFISLEDPAHWADTLTVKALKKKIHEIVQDIKLTRADKLKYSMGGVGGDVLVPMQVLMDASRLQAMEDMEALSIETPYNAVKVRLANMPCVSHAIQSIKKAKKANLPVVIACSDDPMIPENGETFIADLAVGCAAGQLM
eukprot:gene28378-37457_t